MDLDDDLVASSSSTNKSLKQFRKFTPKTGKPKLPNDEFRQPKAETQASAVPGKTEKEESPEFENGFVKMELDPLQLLEEDKPQPSLLNLAEPMDFDVDKEEPEEGSEADMVVRSIDVFLNSSMDPETGLFVMQYPLRPSWRPYELDDRCEEVSIKLENEEEVEMEMEVAVSTDSNWDPETAAKMNFKKQVLTGKGSSEQSDSSIAVAVLINNELFLNPIKSVVQMRPSLQHLDQEKGRRKTKEGETAIKSEPLADKKTAKQWTPLKYHGSKSDFSSLYLQRMISRENSPINFNLNPSQYLSAICPGTSSKNERRSVLSLELNDRIHHLLMKDPPIKRFTYFHRYAKDSSKEEILSALQDHGILVNGLWVAKTSKMKFTPHEERNYAPLARDFVLLQFSNDVVVSAQQFEKGNFKFREQVKIFLTTYAVQRHGNWKFSEARDDSFIQQFPDIFETYKEKWAKAGESILKIVDSLSKSTTTREPIRQPVVQHSSIPPKPKTADRSSSKRVVTDEARVALLKALPKVLNRKVCNYQAVCDELRGFAVAQATLPKADPRIAVAAASVADAPSSEMQEIISEVAVNVHGFYVLKSSPDHPDYDEFRMVVIDMFLKKGANAKLKRSEIFEAARNSLKREVANNEYNKVMLDICVSKGSAWTLKGC